MTFRAIMNFPANRQYIREKAGVARQASLRQGAAEEFTPPGSLPEILPKGLGTGTGRSQATKGEHPMELLELGETMATKYIEDAAGLLIRPAAVESRVSGVIGGRQGVGLRGSADIEGRIIGSKSMGSSRSRDRARSSPVAYELCDDHASRKRGLPVGHRDKREDGQPDSKELFYQREGQALRGNDLSDGPGFIP